LFLRALVAVAGAVGTVFGGASFEPSAALLATAACLVGLASLVGRVFGFGFPFFLLKQEWGADFGKYPHLPHLYCFRGNFGEVPFIFCPAVGPVTVASLAAAPRR